mmetsp:Transcript_13187/g.40976  ORF Transcript_13187/g.40976 Transcript_13187/m.40976 type:complete len:333 (+) Transcript_13187:534-1532(+)
MKLDGSTGGGRETVISQVDNFTSLDITERGPRTPRSPTATRARTPRRGRASTGCGAGPWWHPAPRWYCRCSGATNCRSRARGERWARRPLRGARMLDRWLWYRRPHRWSRGWRPWRRRRDQTGAGDGGGGGGGGGSEEGRFGPARASARCGDPECCCRGGCAEFLRRSPQRAEARGDYGCRRLRRDSLLLRVRVDGGGDRRLVATRGRGLNMCVAVARCRPAWDPPQGRSGASSRTAAARWAGGAGWPHCGATGRSTAERSLLRRARRGKGERARSAALRSSFAAAVSLRDGCRLATLRRRWQNAGRTTPAAAEKRSGRNGNLRRNRTRPSL